MDGNFSRTTLMDDMHIKGTIEYEHPSSVDVYDIVYGLMRIKHGYGLNQDNKITILMD